MRVMVNGMSIDVPDGSSVSVVNGQVTVGGKFLASCPPAAPVYVRVEGNAGSIHTQSGDATVTGDVGGGISTMSGDVKCGKVGGGVSSMSGDINHG